MSHYFALGRQSTLKIGAQAGWIQSSSYFQNELFQVGGFKLMRGFDEEALFANRYLVGNIEYRYLLDKNSRLFSFVDLGQTFNQAILEQRYNQYVGVGAGLSFETKTGILSLSIAVGKQNSNPFDTRQAKIHFGFVSLF
jgi:hemolysin activation/secretion protein